jgi:diadenylate cyclase
MLPLFHIGFLEIRWLDILDVLVVAFLLYKVYELLKGSAAMSIFIGIVAIYVLWWVCSRVLDMKLLGGLLEQFIGVGVLALIVVFQPEIRRFLIMLGSNTFVAKNPLTKKFFKWQPQHSTSKDITPLVKACAGMSKSKTGAIIVIERNTDLKFYCDTGDMMDAEISKRLVENIFFKNSPLHDGAIIISNNKIKAARCVLPVTDNSDLPANYGMRHRAAIGITEQSDAIAIIVSEETGQVSVAVDGKITSNLATDELEKFLAKELK